MFFLKELPSKQMIQGYADRYPIKNVDSVEAALLMMRQASLLIRELEAYFSSHNSSQLRFLILLVIDREPERRSLLVSEISERIDVSRPVMTRTLQSLEGDNFIAIKADKHDGRAKQVFLTEKGRKFLKKILPGYYELIDNFMAGVEA
ncbi:MarR family winged helix-turn-helix transcriptional regulator [Pseudoteredinibacter isoporae]|uniref:DNA-binding MarR family transcriptional regulator n=1 Tax=Pseudoteredinibacter isoporae TaxID=570281 RepID=A0A7X0JYB1_9GAMM|nr:MarR family transcriptional regulator [Pseudoteredinibacter isoporae]MBB6523795.1 DNA-binding MarR family transcriptional regulator [Pseudoteredinibacter isoporae]NHO89315.1 MarR family transcriptional regulator [Pseudoteredinibacter isoporae]NIB22422.1 MarR family transcriptional regulator [Pseudoteredinibacter isoporae]